MRLFNTLIALFLGGITAGALAINYGWSMFIAIPIGMVASGLAYKPQEILSALRRAMQEVVGFDYVHVLRWTGGIMAASIGLIIGFGSWYIYSASIVQVLGREPDSVLAFCVVSILASIMGLALETFKVEGSNQREIFSLNNWLRGHRRRSPWVGAGLFYAALGLLGLPMCVALTTTRVFVPAAIQAWGVAPAVFFRFVELVSTHDRQVVMVSIAIGSLIGIGVGSVLVCGLASMAVGWVAVRTAKAVVRQHRTKTA